MRMENGMKIIFRSGIIVAILILFSAPVWAEMDYEFAKALIARQEPGFSTDDLTERLAFQLDGNPATKSDAKLILATLRRHQAENASLEKRAALLDEAERYYGEILAGSKSFKYYSTAEKESESIASARAATIKKAAQDLSATNPDKSAALFTEAIAAFDKIASRYMAESARAETAFKSIEERIRHTPPNGRAHDELLAALNKTGDEWIVADKRFLNARAEQLECYSDTDTTKKTLAAEIAGICEKRIGSDSLAGLPAVVLWYAYMETRVYTAIGDEEKAVAVVHENLENLDSALSDEQKKQLFNIKKVMIQCLVKMKMRAKKYSDVEEIIVDLKTNPEMNKIFLEHIGKDLMIDYVIAQTLPADSNAEYERAIATLRGLIAKETVHGIASTWANTYSAVMAGIMDDARGKGLRPILQAEEWYNAARGYFVLGQSAHKIYLENVQDNLNKPDDQKQKLQFDKVCSHFQNAVDNYRQAIREARKDKTSILTRVNIEPKAWFEMGLSYLKMKQYYESIVAFSALRETYLPAKRAKWLPDVKRTNMSLELRKVTTPLQAELADLDHPSEGLLVKGGLNVVYALERNQAQYRNADHPWVRPFSARIGGREAKGAEYAAAKNEMDAAKSLSEAARTMDNPGVARENYAQAFQKFTSAAQKFEAISQSTKEYELALFQAGSCYMLAQSLWAENKIQGGAREERAMRCKESGENGLAAYRKYEEWTVKTPAADEKENSRRESRFGTMLLARNGLYLGNRDWPEVIKSANEYIAWEQSSNPPKTAADIALLNKFRALLEEAAGVEAPACSVFLNSADETLKAWRKSKPGDTATLVFMLDALSYRNNIAAFQAQKIIQENPAAISTEIINGYEEKVAEFQAEKIDLAEAAGASTLLEDYSRLAYLFMKTHKEKKAVDVALKMLEKFDPKDKNVKIPDDERVWREMLNQIQYKVISYADLVKDKRCKTDHATLIDYMYETREGVAQANNIEKRPEFDKYNTDMEKAALQLETIKKNYPDCPTLGDPKTGNNILDPRTGKPFEQVVQGFNDWAGKFKSEYPQLQAYKPAAGGPGKSFLGIIEEEIEFRRKIKAARRLIATTGMEIAYRFESAGQADEARRYRGLAIKQIEIVIGDEGEKPELMLKLAAYLKLQGQYEEAIKKASKAVAQLDDTDPLYFGGRKLLAETHALKKHWREALDFPESTARIVGFEAAMVQEHWPNMKEFMKQCYAHAESESKSGVRKNDAIMPDDVRKLMETSDLRGR